MLDRVSAVLFLYRAPLLVLLLALTGVAGWQSRTLQFDASIESQLPLDEPFIQTVLDFKDKIAGLNSVQIVVESRAGEIWTPAFMKTLYDVTQEVIYVPGISRESVASLWTPNTRVYEVVEGAVDGRNLIAQDILAETITPSQIEHIRDDAFKAGMRGRLFSLDSKAAMIHVAVQDIDGASGKKTDLVAMADTLERLIREKFESEHITVRLIGFPKFIGDISHAARDVLIFFGIAFAVGALTLWYYSRSVALTALVLLSSAASVVWLFAIMQLAGLHLNPLGLVVPFLVYAIGVSHGVQQINLFLVATLRGHTGIESAQRAFARLLLPGFFSLLTVLTAFAALLVVPIPFVQDVALIAVIGVALKLVSSLVMLPLAMSYVHFGTAHVERERVLNVARQRIMAAFARDARPLPALVVLLLSAVLAVAAISQAQQVRIGHLAAGASELWPDARYNVDSSAITRDFNVDLDSFVIVTEAPVDACVDYQVLALMERFGVKMRKVPGVKSIMSFPEITRLMYSILQEGNLKWRVLPKVPDVLAATTSAVSETTGLRNSDCTLLPIAVYLTDHRDETLQRVSAAARAFIAANPMKGVTFRLATGNGGVLAAINNTVRRSQFTALGLVFGATSLLVFAAYRDWRAVICCVVPIGLSTALGLWLMAWLEIGMTVSTLPVFVLAVGIGVDYGLYLYERIETHLHEGLAMSDAFAMAMREEGTAVFYTALTLALAVGCWAFSSLKFQADMGWLLAFLVLSNALGAMTLLPAMAVVLDRVLPRRKNWKR